MVNVFNPTLGARANAGHRTAYGYVTRLDHLPPAISRFENLVVFCEEDKRFYECRLTSENKYCWVAVTAGPHRTYLIPVEKLNPEEQSLLERNSSFDAAVSALDEISLGLLRYGVQVEPICHVLSPDTVYKSGTNYFVWNNDYDRAAYIFTKDTVVDIDKTYYFKNDVGDYEKATGLTPGVPFPSGTRYYESTRPMFVRDPDQVPGQPITHRVYVMRTSPTPQTVDVNVLIVKINEIIDILNVNEAHLSKATTLNNLSRVINLAIDEVNPFSVPWQSLLDRVAAVERQIQKIKTN